MVSPVRLTSAVDVSRVCVRLIGANERLEWDRVMRAHHYLGLTALVGRSLRYVAEVDGAWLALLGWASAALKCASRDRWIGWSPTLQWQRLNLIANNSRFLHSARRTGAEPGLTDSRPHARPAVCGLAGGAWASPAPGRDLH